MAVYKRGYRRYDGPLTPLRSRLLVLPRFAWARLFQDRLVVVAMVVAAFFPLLCGAYIYLAGHAELWGGLGQGFLNSLNIDGTFFLVFMNAQAGFAVILAALSGPGLIAPDLANNALPLYFSRPFSRMDYALARLITLAGLLGLVTVVPGVLLFGMQTGIAGGQWAWDHWNYAAALTAGFLVWILLVSLVALASSAWVKWRIVAGALVLAFFFITAGASAMINAVFRDTWGTLLNPSRLMYHLWCEMLGVTPPDGPAAWESLTVLLALAALLGLVIERKLRPVDVVR
jgi:ABC-2 type transport system permease protein